MGDLDKEGERQLFASLAYDEELRDEMKTMMTIKSNIGHNIARYVEPVPVKANIFKSLGYSFPGQSSNVPTTDINSRLFKRSLFTSILTCLISVAGTIIIMTQFILPDKDYIYFTRLPIPVKLFPGNTDKAAIVADAKENEKRNNKEKSHVDNDNTTHNVTAASLQPEVSDETPAVPEQDTRMIETSGIASLRYKPVPVTEVIPVYSYPSSLDNPEGGTKEGDDSQENISIEIRNSESWFLPKETISPSKKNSLNNYSITSLYKISSSLSAGPDLRQETFYVEYSGTENDKEYNYYQQPNLTSFGVALRYTPFDYNHMNPFLQLTAAVNKGGYVARAMGGAEVRITDNIGLVMGVEYNLLLFTHDRSVFPAHKFNLNYGLIVRY